MVRADAPTTTAVSAASTGLRSSAGTRRQTASAFSAASRSTNASGASPAACVSTISAGRTSNGTPIWRSSSLRRGEAEAR